MRHNITFSVKIISIVFTQYLKQFLKMFSLAALLFFSASTCQESPFGKSNITVSENLSEIGKEKVQETEDIRPEVMTKILKLEEIQITFELLEIDEYNRMFSTVDFSLSEKNLQNQAFNYTMLLTLLDEEQLEHIKDAEVTLTMVDPGGKEFSQKCKIISDTGMNQYSSSFKIETAGRYTFLAEINDGGKNYTVETYFEIQQ